jgi:hypothetical protein
VIISESIVNISKAMLAVQANMIQPKKTAENPFFKSRYVNLDGTVNAIKELCAENGLSYTQSIVSSEAGIGVQTMIMHTSGEYIIHEPFYLPVAQKTAQSGASSATYARRYALSAAFGIVADEDDDGNGASQQPQKNLDF